MFIYAFKPVTVPLIHVFVALCMSEVNTSGIAMLFNRNYHFVDINKLATRESNVQQIKLFNRTLSMVITVSDTLLKWGSTPMPIAKKFLTLSDRMKSFLEHKYYSPIYPKKAKRRRGKQRNIYIYDSVVRMRRCKLFGGVRFTAIQIHKTLTIKVNLTSRAIPHKHAVGIDFFFSSFFLSPLLKNLKNNLLDARHGTAR